MKTKHSGKIIQRYLPAVLAAMLQVTTLHSQENRPVLRWPCGGLALVPSAADSFHGVPNRIIPGRKSEGTALALSLLGTLVPTAMGLSTLSGENTDPLGSVVLISTGIVFGPSLGYFYAGRSGRGLTGIGIRLGLSAATVGATAAVGSSSDGWEALDQAAVVFLIGSGAVAVAAITDVVLVPGAVRQHNRYLRGQVLTITPAYFAEHRTAGLSLQVQF